MATVSASGDLPLRTEHDIVLGRQAVRRLAQEQGFSLVDQTKLVTAASELARNTVTYGGGGVLIWQVLVEEPRRGIRLVFADEGPGIADVKLALTDGWTSGSGMGLGLSGARRLVNEFDIDTAVGRGTRITVARWR